MELERWQEQLEVHFSTLAQERASTGLPIFALEHGLAKSELEQIFQGLHDYLSDGILSARQWLLWTVYAAEQGYSYEGGEYWHSFERDTPHWDSRYRYRLASWFHKFRREFNGYIPSGTWAQHFSIIAWPITHAILPRYLQYQFARTIYDLRFKLSRISSLEPVVIGRMISANTYHATTRFEQFLQQEELVGRIVIGLLHAEPKQGEEPILNATLERIVKDLESVRNARGWIKETSRVVTDRFKGLSNGNQRITQGRRTEPKVQIRPRLYLRLSKSKSFSIQMEIPSFRPLAELDAEVQAFLKTTRCSLNGERAKKPSGWLLTPKPKAILREWPDPEKPLISFEKPNGFIENLLASDCVLDHGPVWVFRMGTDGLAMEIKTKVIRPNYSYVFVSRREFKDLLPHMERCEIESQNLFSISVQAISDIDEDYLEWLKANQLSFAKTINLWPAGLSSRNWDNEGYSEWLTTEKPCIGILADHPVKSYTITLNEESGTVVNAKNDGTPNFIQLPSLEPGNHTLKVKCSRLEEANNTPENNAYLDGFLQLHVREPEPWIKGTTSHAGLVVRTNPFDPTLDCFWENEAELSVLGPENRVIFPEVALEDAEGNEFYSAKVCEQIQLPVTPEIWQKKFQDFLKREKADWRYLSAASGLLKLHGHELGEYRVRFDYQPRPVRWLLEHDGSEILIHLIDDTGKEDLELNCYFYSFEKPIEVNKIDNQSVNQGLKVECPGGLYLVEDREQTYRDTLIVSSGLTDEGLLGLGVQPTYGKLRKNTETVLELLHILSNWRHARLAGFLANARRHNVVQGLLNAIYGQLCGWPWAHAEKFCASNEDIESSLNSLESHLETRGGFCVLLRRDALTINPEYQDISAWFFNAASRYHISNDQALCKFVIDFVSRPQELPSIYGGELHQLIKDASKNPLLVKTARFVAVIWALNNNKYSDMLPRWNDDSRD